MNESDDTIDTPTTDTCKGCGGSYSEKLDEDTFQCPNCGDIYVF